MGDIIDYTQNVWFSVKVETKNVNELHAEVNKNNFINIYWKY